LIFTNSNHVSENQFFRIWLFKEQIKLSYYYVKNVIIQYMECYWTSDFRVRHWFDRNINSFFKPPLCWNNEWHF